MVRDIDDGITLRDIAQDNPDPRAVPFGLMVGVPQREGADAVCMTEAGDIVTHGHVGRREYEEDRGHKPSDDWYVTFDGDAPSWSRRVVGECRSEDVVIVGPERVVTAGGKHLIEEMDGCPVCGADCSRRGNGGDE